MRCIEYGQKRTDCRQALQKNRAWKMVRYEQGKVSIDFVITKLKEMQAEEGNGDIVQEYYLLNDKPVKYSVAIEYLKDLRREGYEFTK